MDQKTQLSFLINPLYAEAQNHFQKGEWDIGLEKLKKLEESYPLDHELRKLRQEMQIRARIDFYEDDDNQRIRRNRVFIYGLRGLVTIILLGLVYMGIQTYSGWVQQQWLSTKTKVNTEIESIDLTIKYRNAQNLLQAGNAQAAVSLLNEVKQADPSFLEIDQVIQQAQELINREVIYNQANQLMDQGKYSEAITALNEIKEQDPNYRDVLLRIEQLSELMDLDQQFADAVTAFQNNQWEDAIQHFELLQGQDLTFKKNEIEDYLVQSYLNTAESVLTTGQATLQSLSIAETNFRKALALRPQDTNVLNRRDEILTALEDRLVESYINLAEETLLNQEDSIKALKTAQDYFSKALAIRPGDATILARQDAAQRYLAAIDSFDKGLWDDAIANLEYLYAYDVNYAKGTARQTLYDVLIAHGQSSMASGDFEIALQDYKRAAVIAEESPESTLRLFEAQLHIAEVQGLLGNYQDAVQIYRAAIDLGEFGILAAQRKTSLAEALKTAGIFTDQGNYKLAYQTYRLAMDESKDVFDTIKHVVSDGEYLTMIARQYNSTVQAILDANGLSNRNKVELNQELIIPTLPSP